MEYLANSPMRERLPGLFHAILVSSAGLAVAGRGRDLRESPRAPVPDPSAVGMILPARPNPSSPPPPTI